MFVGAVLEMVCARALTAHFLIGKGKWKTLIRVGCGMCVPIFWLSCDLPLVSGNDFTTYVLLGLVYRKTSAQCSAVETELRSSLVSPYSDMTEKLDSFLSPCCLGRLCTEQEKKMQ